MTYNNHLQGMGEPPAHPKHTFTTGSDGQPHVPPSQWPANTLPRTLGQYTDDEIEVEYNRRRARQIDAFGTTMEPPIRMSQDPVLFPKPQIFRRD